MFPPCHSRIVILSWLSVQWFHESELTLELHSVVPGKWNTKQNASVRAVSGALDSGTLSPPTVRLRTDISVFFVAYMRQTQHIAYCTPPTERTHSASLFVKRHVAIQALL